jgi:hypothetical protein
MSLNFLKSTAITVSLIQFYVIFNYLNIRLGDPSGRAVRIHRGHGSVFLVRCFIRYSKGLYVGIRPWESNRVWFIWVRSGAKMTLNLCRQKVERGQNREWWTSKRKNRKLTHSCNAFVNTVEFHIILLWKFLFTPNSSTKNRD